MFKVCAVDIAEDVFNFRDHLPVLCVLKCKNYQFNDVSSNNLLTGYGKKFFYVYEWSAIAKHYYYMSISVAS